MITQTTSSRGRNTEYFFQPYCRALLTHIRAIPPQSVSEPPIKKKSRNRKAREGRYSYLRCLLERTGERLRERERLTFRRGEGLREIERGLLASREGERERERERERRSSIFASAPF